MSDVRRGREGREREGDDRGYAGMTAPARATLLLSLM
jgi:hypothetical protein